MKKIKNPIIYKVTILDWEKYQKQKTGDLKSYPWFKFYTRTMHDNIVYRMSGEQFKIWVTMLSVCAENGSSTIEVSPENMARMCRVYSKNVLGTLLLLEQNQYITCSPIALTRREEKRRDKTRKDKTRISPKGDGGCDLKIAPPEKIVLEILPKEVLKPKLSDVYKTEFLKKWGKEPPPLNARVATMFKKLETEYGFEISQNVIKHYFVMNDSYYIKNFHPVGLLVTQAHQIFSSMTTGRVMTRSSIANIENSSSIREAMKAVDRGEI